MTGVAAALVEAWSEIRVHKVRVVLSLVGVMLAVLAMTAITALGDMARQANAEYVERMSGRPATLTVNAFGTEQAISGDAIRTAYADVVERYQVEYSSLAGWGEQAVRFTDGTHRVQLTLVEPDYGDMHRVVPAAGRWFTDDDEDRYAPAIVVNSAFHDRLGAPDLASHPTVVLGGDRPVRATVVGVVADGYSGEDPRMFTLTALHDRWAGQGDAEMFGPPSLELWVPTSDADRLRELIIRDLSAALPGTQVDVYRADSEGFDVIDGQIRWVIRGVGAFALGLGALGLVNIALVTVKYRIREIGIRRSYGATSGRVFFSVMMESVAATVVAGLVGVALAVAIVTNVPVETLVGGAVSDVPPFPVRAAAEGMVAATIVGALAGLLPATVAVRVKVIDAIRY